MRRLPIYILGFFLVAIAASVLIYLRLLDVPANFQSETATFTVVKGQGVKSIAQELQDQKLIRYPLVFKIEVKLRGAQNSFFPGTYTIVKNVSIRDIITKLTAKPNVEEVVIRIREGWTSQEIAEALQNSGVMTSEAFLIAAQARDSRTVAPNQYYEFLVDKPATATLEGYLFPDTYRFFKSTTPDQVVQKLLDTFSEKVVTSLQDQISASKHSVFQIVTLASIIEKEVKSDADRRIAAGIFWKRLELGMPLQSDATVNFVTGKQALQPTNTDLSVDSLYNTYKHPGLPPGPIDNPSFSAIRAAVTPEETSYLYFLTKPDGTTVFSKSYEEHLANKRKYLN
jgi:UPF0755 protein